MLLQAFMRPGSGVVGVAPNQSLSMVLYLTTPPSPIEGGLMIERLAPAVNAARSRRLPPLTGERGGDESRNSLIAARSLPLDDWRGVTPEVLVERVRRLEREGGICVGTSAGGEWKRQEGGRWWGEGVM